MIEKTYAVLSAKDEDEGTAALDRLAVTIASETLKKARSTVMLNEVKQIQVCRRSFS
ncbi:MAG: hypothetical protein MAG453_00028 [Calditrichaeota bacterium]|nr:hypothetical protein [Calditrichota bacterium]